MSANGPHSACKVSLCGLQMFLHSSVKMYSPSHSRIKITHLVIDINIIKWLRKF